MAKRQAKWVRINYPNLFCNELLSTFIIGLTPTRRWLLEHFLTETPENQYRSTPWKRNKQVLFRNGLLTSHTIVFFSTSSSQRPIIWYLPMRRPRQNKQWNWKDNDKDYLLWLGKIAKSLFNISFSFLTKVEHGKYHMTSHRMVTSHMVTACDKEASWWIWWLWETRHIAITVIVYIV